MAYNKEQREAKNKEISNSTTSESTAPKKLQIRNLPLSTTVWVYSNCFGGLKYISKKTGYTVAWDSFKSKQPISLEELITMKNTQRIFFERNWILLSTFADAEYENEFSIEEILDFLQVRQYYSNVLCPENLEEIFDMNATEIENRVPNMSIGVKTAISVRANELIEFGKLDSLTKIKALEKALGCELIRP